jgi:hypothetical protein
MQVDTDTHVYLRRRGDIYLCTLLLEVKELLCHQ